VRRIGPRSLRGQILLAVLAALALAQGVGAAITIFARAEAVRVAMLNEAMDRTAALVFVLERTEPDLHPPLLRTAEIPLTRLSLDPMPATRRLDPALRRQARRLASALDDAVPRDLRLALVDARPVRPARESTSGKTRKSRPEAERAFRGRGAERLEARALSLSVPLADGLWLNAQFGLLRPDRGLPALSGISFALAAAAIGAALWLTLSRLLGPLRRLGAAAERLGRGEDAKALPVAGPAEMRALTEAFNAMQTRLTRLVHDRTKMLAALGHDLRSPLTALRVRAEMVDDDETRERLLISLAEMQEMVDQTLTYARGVWTAEAMADVDIASLVTELADEAGFAATVPPQPVILRLRPSAVRRGLRNLIDNARRYGTVAEIALAANATMATITVADRGPGIPEADLARVFDPFVRLESSRSRETGGTGLGLSIARSIMQAHGGEVTLQNRSGGGLIATVTLPRPAH